MKKDTFVRIVTAMCAVCIVLMWLLIAYFGSRRMEENQQQCAALGGVMVTANNGDPICIKAQRLFAPRSRP